MDTGSRKWGRPYLTRSFFDLVGASMAERVLLVMAKRGAAAPSPARSISSATTRSTAIASGELPGPAAHTFTEVGTAFAVSVAAGGALGALVHAQPRLRRALDPLLASWYAVPFFVFYPLLVALFGLNALPLIAIGVIFAAPAMMLSTLAGLDRVPRVMRKVARVHRLSRVQEVRLITLPSAAPHLFTGLKLAFAYSFIGVIAGEFILSGGGLGYGIAYAYESFENRTMYGLMLFVLLIAIGVNGALHVWDARLARRRGRA